MIPYKYEDNLEKVNHIYNQLDLITNYALDSLVFNIKNGSCEITYKEHAFELKFEDNDYPTPKSMIFHNTNKIELYQLMLFITDKVRVKS